MPSGNVLDLLGDDKQALVSHIPHARALGMTIVDAKRGEAWVRIPHSDRLVGNPDTGVIHGGVITTLLDNAGGSAVIVALDEPRSIATLDLRIDYMKPATPKRDLVAWCRCYKITANVAFVRGVAYHDDPEDAIASSVMTFMLGANPTLPAVYRALESK